MAVEPKPRPRAFRLGAMTPEPGADAPKEAVVIETTADPYEAEAEAFWPVAMLAKRRSRRRRNKASWLALYCLGPVFSGRPWAASFRSVSGSG